MTPAEEQEFIALWNAGTPTAEIAARLGIPAGTARSRAYTLQQGKIAARPKGGRRTSPGWRAPLHQCMTVQSSALPPIPAVLAGEFKRLWAAVDALRQAIRRPVQDPVHDAVQSLPEPLFDDPIDNATERWNLYLKRGLRVRIEALAQARGVAPSRVVQEILFHALHDR
jgi:hypothetical protein